MSEVEHVLPCRNKLGEGPIWSEDEQALYWVDILNHTYSRFDPISDKQDTTKVGIAIGVMAFRQAGGLIMATKEGFAYWDKAQKKLDYLARPLGDDPTMRFNDGAVDCKGRFWAGSMGNGPVGILYRLDPDGSLHEMLHGVSIANGIGWSPDNTIMYFTDTPLKKIFAFDFDAETGSISHQRVFVDSTSEDGVPDGLAVDSQGYIWSARWDGSRITRYAPNGGIERVITMPVLRPTSCVFGGRNLDELYITSAQTEDQDRRNFPLSGDLFRLKTGIRGLPAYKFGA
ncbi:gluconolactonase [Tengunoibacter tsumagoiensis]|uniref:Gluconolactonase n=1 Tax=Tengunoibacter tsumagoiensis TaxID=2014871 RepID=A0A401ZWN5_9CHLR|nr:gluconolactonase [Tengunoibacter tsumagoiensis]